MKMNFNSLFLFSLLFGLTEFLRGNILTGFPWNLIAFSFSENLEILKVNITLNDEQHIFGTALSFSEKEIEDIRESLMAGFRFKNPQYSNPRIKNIDCVTLLKDFL